MSWGRASNSLNYNLQLNPLFRKNANVSALPLLFPEAAQADYIPWFVFRGGRTNNAGQYQTDRGPFTNENITHDVIANVTKVWGTHASKGGFYYQNSFKPQSIFAASTARSTSPTTPTTRSTPASATRMRPPACSTSTTQANQVRAARMALPQVRVVRTGQLETEPPG